MQIQIAFRPRDALFEVADAAIRRDPEFIPDISKLWTEGMTSFKIVRNFLNNLNETHELTEEDEETISSAIDRVYDLQNYPFTAMEIASTVDEQQVADIFVRINSKGVQLRQADFILTLLSVFWDEGRANLETFARESRRPPANNTPSPFNHFIQPAPDQLLRTSVALGFKRARLQHVYSILRGKDLDTGQFSDERRIEQFEILKKAQNYVLNVQNWHDFLTVLVRAGFRSNSMITSEMAIIYAYAMFLIGKYNYTIDLFILRNLMARWFFMTALTGRYSGSPETIMDQDLARLRNIKDGHTFILTLTQIIDGALTNDFWEITLPNSLETSAARSPYLFGYYAALNLLDARVLFSHMKVQELLDPALRTKRSPVERHHLFPKAYLKRIGIEETRAINQAANFALVEWGDNLDIKDQHPADYFPEYMERFSEEEIRQMMFWHALPEGWYEMDYETFLSHRRVLMAKVIRLGFEQLTL